jgi:hypothetical protein
LSWCDKLASTAGAGLKLDVHFAAGDAILTALSPLLDTIPKGDKQKFNMNRHESFNVTFTTEDGFQYGIEPTRMFVAFTHRIKARPVSGGPPVMEMLSQPMPFTKLLPIVLKKTVDAACLLPSQKNRTAVRIGIISTTSVAEKELPPGIARFISYIGRPWKGALDAYDFSITSEVGKGTTWSDRCIHQIKKLEDPEELMTLNFDFQRTFTTGLALRQDALTEAAKAAEKGALKYFEDLGEGASFDEEIIRRAT